MKSASHKAILIGCGRAGRGTLEEYLKHPGADVVAVVDPVRPSGLSATIPIYDNLDHALSEVQANVAFISSPNCLHAEHFQTCVQRGLHVWIEKPVALSVEDAIEMRDAAERSAVKIMTPYACEKQFALADALARHSRGEFGNLVQITAIRTGSNGFVSQGFGGHYAVLRPEVSGGWIFHHLCHMVDWAMQIGGAVARVYCSTQSTVPAGDVQQNTEEAVTCMLDFVAGGAACLVENQLKHKHHRFTVMGDRGGVFIDDYPKPSDGEPRMVIQTCTDDRSERVALDTSAVIEQQTKLTSPVRRFLDAIANDAPSPSSLERSVDVLRVCWALRESAQSGRVISVFPPDEVAAHG